MDIPAANAVCEGGDLDCGNGLLLIIRKAMDPLLPGQVLEIRSRERSVGEDLPAWCRMVSHELLGSEAQGVDTRYFVRKGGAAPNVEDDLEKARSFTWAVRVRSDGESDTRCRVYARQASFMVGQPVEFGFASVNLEDPVSAVEHLLGSLGACLLVGYRVHASRAGVVIDQAELSLRGNLENPLVYLGLEEAGSPGLSRVQGTLYVSTDADESVMRDLWETTLRRSPVLSSLHAGLQMDLQIQVSL